MAKFCGILGFIKTVETSPGVWKESIEEKTCYGDWARNSRRFQSGEQIHDNLVLNNELSIISDGFVMENLQHIRYVHFSGAKWKVLSIENRYPRLLLTIGGVYNG